LGPEWTNSHQHIIHWKSIITQLFEWTPTMLFITYLMFFFSLWIIVRFLLFLRGRYHYKGKKRGFSILKGPTSGQKLLFLEDVTKFMSKGCSFKSFLKLCHQLGEICLNLPRDVYHPGCFRKFGENTMNLSSMEILGLTSR